MRFLARSLERGLGARLGVLRAAARVYGAFARPVRDVVLPEGLAVVGVGGAVLGGAGKTPLSIALTRGLAESGLRAALVGHGYRRTETPSAAFEVTPSTGVQAAGDDAAFAARALAGKRATVVVGASRAAALAYAHERGAEVAVVDSLLQAAPRRLAASILTLDGHAPWGGGACPPAGDLRASREALLGACDVVALLVDPLRGAASAAIAHAHVVELETRLSCEVAFEELAQRRVALVVGIGHPERVVSSLEARGVRLVHFETFSDHAPFDRNAMRRLEDATRRHRIETWLTTRRCATKLPTTLGSAPVVSVVHEVFPGPLLPWILRRIGGHSYDSC